MYKLCFFVPIAFAQTVKDAIFAAGAGKIGNYEHCAWQCVGHGQFKPMNGAKPFIGSLNTLEVVDELKIETIVQKKLIKQVVEALKKAHPYEEPAYEVIELLDI